MSVLGRDSTTRFRFAVIRTTVRRPARAPDRPLASTPPRSLRAV